VKKCGDKFFLKWAKLEGRAMAAGATCPDGMVDPNVLRNFIADHADAVASALAGGPLPTLAHCGDLDADADGYPWCTDCDDDDPESYPGNLEVCDGKDNDCDPVSADGSEDPQIGVACDGGDSDLCIEGAYSCIDGSLECSDNTGDDLDLCNGDTNDDCNVATPDGSDEPTMGDPCDGADSDLCEDGSLHCAGVSGMQCNDSTDDHPDLCNGTTNDDCNVATPDGSDEPTLGDPCDGSDTDLCQEGSYSCVAGSLGCSDTSGSTVDVCDGLDNDCDPLSNDGDEDPLNGAACDGSDSDLCEEGTYTGCSGGVLQCSDTTGHNLDVCDGLDNDCDPVSNDGDEDPLNGAACDGSDSDLCEEGTYTGCSGGVLQCSDTTGDTVEICDNETDDDCDELTDGDDPDCT
jgi:hypothetical protein